MEQFFILKKYRNIGVGAGLARHVLQGHPGPWEVGQMKLNIPAQALRRKLIGSLTSGCYDEVQVTEGRWQGVVQRFNYEAAALPVDQPVAR